MPDLKAQAEHRSLLQQARHLALRSIENARRAVSEANAILALVQREEAALLAAAGRGFGGVDEPGLSRIGPGEPCFEYWRKGAGHCGSVPVLGAPMAAKGLIDLLNEQHVSKPQLRN